MCRTGESPLYVLPGGPSSFFCCEKFSRKYHNCVHELAKEVGEVYGCESLQCAVAAFGFEQKVSHIDRKPTLYCEFSGVAAKKKGICIPSDKHYIYRHLAYLKRTF